MEGGRTGGRDGDKMGKKTESHELKCPSRQPFLPYTGPVGSWAKTRGPISRAPSKLFMVKIVYGSMTSKVYTMSVFKTVPLLLRALLLLVASGIKSYKSGT